MGINVFPPASGAAGGNFVVDINDTTNNVATLDSPKGAGTYNISLDSGDTSFDIYLIDSNGNSVGYSNSASITASSAFEQVAVLGVVSSEIISFSFAGVVSNASSTGSTSGAGAYLASISPTDLPEINDTATVIGGNFGTNTEFTFESGATVLQAKNAVIISGTEALVTRPDALIEDDAPYDFKVVNPGVPTPTTKTFLLTDEVTAGSDPTWVTTSPLDISGPNQAFSQTLEATDSDGTVDDYEVVAGTITPGLSLASSTGVLSGTPTTEGDFTFTVRATDSGGNSTDREFTQTIAVADGGTVTSDATFTYHTFTSSDTFTLAETKDIEYLVVAGGGGGGAPADFNGGGGGGGAGGLLNGTETVAAGSYTVVVGAGGAQSTNGSNSEFDTFATAIGGGSGGGGSTNRNGSTGGSGGGGGANRDYNESGSGASGTAGQGNSGGNGSSALNSYGNGGGGGGAGTGGQDGGTGYADPGDGGNGLTFQAWADATGIGTGEFAAGGNGGDQNGNPVTGSGVAGGPANTGAGGGGGGDNNSGQPSTDGVVILRFVS